MQPDLWLEASYILVIENWPDVTFLEKNLQGFTFPIYLRGQYDLIVSGYLQFYEREHNLII